ncbi:hypothetical protein J0H33_14620 [bacterium]|nr:hypothetical protein [bacterium]
MIVGIALVLACWVVAAIVWSVIASATRRRAQRMAAAAIVAAPIVAGSVAAAVYSPSGYEPWPTHIFALVWASLVALAALMVSVIALGFAVSKRG